MPTTYKIRLIANGRIIFEADDETIFGDKTNWVVVNNFKLSGDDILLCLEVTKESNVKKESDSYLCC